MIRLGVLTHLDDDLENLSLAFHCDDHQIKTWARMVIQYSKEFYDVLLETSELVNNTILSVSICENEVLKFKDENIDQTQPMSALDLAMTELKAVQFEYQILEMELIQTIQSLKRIVDIN